MKKVILIVSLLFIFENALADTVCMPLHPNPKFDSVTLSPHPRISDLYLAKVSQTIGGELVEKSWETKRSDSRDVENHLITVLFTESLPGTMTFVLEIDMQRKLTDKEFLGRIDFRGIAGEVEEFVRCRLEN